MTRIISLPQHRAGFSVSKIQGQAPTPVETGSYLKHHLALAGRTDTLFSDDAVALIHQTSRGYPRAVNNLAVQALTAAYAADKAIVDENAARAAITEVTTD